MNRFSALLVTTAIAGACSAVPPERKLIDDAAQALGGADRVRAVKTVLIQGTGTAPLVGQNRMPDDDLPIWKVSEYTRTIDLASDRTRVAQVREAQFQFAGDLVQRQTQGLDGDVAYNVGADGMT